jgi:hypothetical protein
VTAQEANANAVTDAPSGYLVSEGVDDADDLMPRYHRLAGVGTQALDGEHIAVADTATLHTKPHMTRLRVQQLTLRQFELPLPCDLKRAIGRHAKPPSVGSTWHGFGWRTVIHLGEAPADSPPVSAGSLGLPDVRGIGEIEESGGIREILLGITDGIRRGEVLFEDDLVLHGWVSLFVGRSSRSVKSGGCECPHGQVDQLLIARRAGFQLFD